VRGGRAPARAAAPSPVSRRTTPSAISRSTTPQGDASRCSKPDGAAAGTQASPHAGVVGEKSSDGDLTLSSRCRKRQRASRHGKQDPLRFGNVPGIERGSAARLVDSRPLARAPVSRARRDRRPDSNRSVAPFVQQQRRRRRLHGHRCPQGDVARASPVSATTSPAPRRRATTRPRACAPKDSTVPSSQRTTSSSASASPSPKCTRTSLLAW